MNPNRLVLPNILPDETLYSLAARIYQLNSEATEREFCSQLLGDSEALRVADADVDLSRFEKITRGFYGDAENLLATTTLGCLYRRLGTVPDAEAPKHAPDNIPLQPTGLATLSNGRPHVWRACRSCITEDQAEHGTSYWHRTHQLPGTTVCLKHNEPLLELNLPYRDRQSAFILTDQLIDQFDLVPAHAKQPPSALLLRIAEIAKKALLDSAPGNSAEVVQGALVDGLAERGLLTRSGRINKRAFVEEFNGFYSELVGTSEFSPFLLERNLLRLADRLTRETLLLPATLTLMLALWLFGSWELFHEHRMWRAAMHRDNDSSMFPLRDPPVSNDQPGTLRNLHRKACLEFLQSNPGAMRRDFWVAQPRPCRWLCTYDEDWLESQLPLTFRGRRTQMTLF